MKTAFSAEDGESIALDSDMGFRLLILLSLQCEIKTLFTNLTMLSIRFNYEETEFTVLVMIYILY